MSIKNILVGYDGFERGEGLPRLAVGLAASKGAHLHVVNVVPRMPHYFFKKRQETAKKFHAEMIKHREELLEAVLGPVRERGIEATASVRIGSPAEEIIRGAMKVDADLVVISDEPFHRKNTRGFGVVTMSLLRDCPFPVLAERLAQSATPHDHILAAVDLGPEGAVETSPNGQIMNMARLLSEHDNCHLTVFHAWVLWGELLMRNRNRMPAEEVDALVSGTRDEKQGYLDALIEESKLDAIKYEGKLLKGEARHVLSKVIEENKVDLVVMGTVTRAGLPGFLIGNTAERILNRLSCSVLTVKPEGFVSPVEPASDD